MCSSMFLSSGTINVTKKRRQPRLRAGFRSTERHLELASLASPASRISPSNHGRKQEVRSPPAKSLRPFFFLRWVDANEIDDEATLDVAGRGPRKSHPNVSGKQCYVLYTMEPVCTPVRRLGIRLVSRRWTTLLPSWAMFSNCVRLVWSPVKSGARFGLVKGLEGWFVQHLLGHFHPQIRTNKLRLSHIAPTVGILCRRTVLGKRMPRQSFH